MCPRDSQPEARCPDSARPSGVVSSVGVIVDRLVCWLKVAVQILDVVAELMRDRIGFGEPTVVRDRSIRKYDDALEWPVDHLVPIAIVRTVERSDLGDVHSLPVGVLVRARANHGTLVRAIDRLERH